MPRTSSPHPTQRTANTSGWRPGPGASPLTLGLAALFLLPFVVLGLSMLLFGVGPKVVDWARAQSWQATPAVVESAATIKEPGHKGGTASGVEVRYRYEVDGKVSGGSGPRCMTAPTTSIAFNSSWARGWRPLNALAPQCRSGPTRRSPLSRSWTAACAWICLHCS